MSCDEGDGSDCQPSTIITIAPNLRLRVCPCIKGRFTGELIRLIDDILYHIEQENIDGVLFAADIEKAFDSVEHSLIFAVLKKFGFGYFYSMEAVV